MQQSEKSKKEPVIKELFESNQQKEEQLRQLETSSTTQRTSMAAQLADLERGMEQYHSIGLFIEQAGGMVLVDMVHCHILICHGSLLNQRNASASASRRSIARIPNAPSPSACTWIPPPTPSLVLLLMIVLCSSSLWLTMFSVSL